MIPQERDFSYKKSRMSMLVFIMYNSSYESMGLREVGSESLRHSQSRHGFGNSLSRALAFGQ